MTAYTDPHGGSPGDFPVGLAFALALVTAVLLALCGCCPTREVLVEPPAPPPTVVTVTDTVRLASPPDTLYRVVTQSDTVRVTETVPEVVTVYAAPRPDTSRATRLHALIFDPPHVVVIGTRRDWTFRYAAVGERTVIESAAPDSLVARIEGVPSPPPPQRVECPACPGPTLAERLRPWLYGLLGLLVGCSVGVVLRSFLSAR